MIKMENVVISNEAIFEKLQKNFQEGGLIKVHVLADFDKTLTRAFIDGKEIPSIISILRDGNYLTPDYAIKAHTLYNKYHPFENDLGITKEKRKELMAEWWTTHFDLLIKSGLSQQDIEKVITSNEIKFREGFSEFIDFLKNKRVPLVIMSSAGLGRESISLRLKKEEKLFENVHIISNSFKWDREGKAIMVNQPVVHCANKDETLVQEFPDIFEAVKNRKNVILLGDNLDDVGMVEGFDYDNLIKIGFLNNEKTDEKAYKNAYDVLILKDSSMNFVNDFLQKVKE